MRLDGQVRGVCSTTCRRGLRRRASILCRSGASTVAELAAAGRAAVLVPFPGAADDHQLRNAEEMSREGAAVLLERGSEGFEDAAFSGSPGAVGGCGGMCGCRWVRRLEDDGASGGGAGDCGDLCRVEEPGGERWTRGEVPTLRLKLRDHGAPGEGIR